MADKQKSGSRAQALWRYGHLGLGAFGRIEMPRPPENRRHGPTRYDQVRDDQRPRLVHARPLRSGPSPRALADR